MFRREPTQAITEEATPPISWWLGEIMIYLKLCWHFGYFSAPLYGDIEFPQKAGLQLWQATHNTIPGFRHYAGRSRVALLFGGQQWQRHTFAILNCKTIRHSRPLSITPPQSYKLNNIQCIAFLLQILSQFSCNICRFVFRRKTEISLTTFMLASNNIEMSISEVFPASSSVNTESLMFTHVVSPALIVSSTALASIHCNQTTP